MLLTRYPLQQTGNVKFLLGKNNKEKKVQEFGQVPENRCFLSLLHLIAIPTCHLKFCYFSSGPLFSLSQNCWQQWNLLFMIYFSYLPVIHVESIMKTASISKAMPLYLQFLLAQQMHSGSSNMQCFMKVSLSHNKLSVNIFLVQTVYRFGLQL